MRVNLCLVIEAGNQGPRREGKKRSPCLVVHKAGREREEKSTSVKRSFGFLCKKLQIRGKAQSDIEGAHRGEPQLKEDGFGEQSTDNRGNSR